MISRYTLSFNIISNFINKIFKFNFSISIGQDITEIFKKIKNTINLNQNTKLEIITVCHNRKQEPYDLTHTAVKLNISLNKWKIDKVQVVDIVGEKILKS